MIKYPKLGLTADILSRGPRGGNSIIAPHVRGVTVVGPLVEYRHNKDTGTAVTPNIAPIFEWRDDSPPVRLFRRTLGNGGTYIHAEPMVNTDEPVEAHFMAGGSFIWTCDSRLREVNAYPIPLHDHVEGSLRVGGKVWSVAEYRESLGWPKVGGTPAQCPFCNAAFHGANTAPTVTCTRELWSRLAGFQTALEIAATTLETVYRERDPSNIAAKCAAERARATIAKDNEARR